MPSLTIPSDMKQLFKDAWKRMNIILLVAGVGWLALALWYQGAGKDWLFTRWVPRHNYTESKTPLMGAGVQIQYPAFVPPCNASFRTEPQFLWTLQAGIDSRASSVQILVMSSPNIVFLNQNGKDELQWITLPSDENSPYGRRSFYVCFLPDENQQVVTLQIEQVEPGNSNTNVLQVRKVSVSPLVSPVSKGQTVWLTLLAIVLSNPIWGGTTFLLGIIAREMQHQQEQEKEHRKEQEEKRKEDEDDKRVLEQQITALHQQIQSVANPPFGKAGTQYIKLWQQIQKQLKAFPKLQSEVADELRFTWQQKFMSPAMESNDIVLLPLRQRALRWVGKIADSLDGPATHQKLGELHAKWHKMLLVWEESQVGFNDSEIKFLQKILPVYFEIKVSLQNDEQQQKFADDMVNTLMIFGSQYIYHPMETNPQPALSKLIAYHTKDIEDKAKLNSAFQQIGGAAGWSLWMKSQGKIPGEYAPHVLQGKCSLWPDVEIGETIPPNPFGPKKGEHEPRLPVPVRGEKEQSGLFFDGGPGWKDACSKQHVVFQSPPGCGRSTLIWMGRHKHRPWGVKDRMALSLYLPLNGKASLEQVQIRFYQAVGQSLLAATVEDPSWVFDASRDIQREALQFLSQWAGGGDRLKRCVYQCGLMPNTADYRLLSLLISQYATETGEISGQRCLTLLNELKPFLVPPTRGSSPQALPVFLWADIYHPYIPGAWLQVLQEWGGLWDAVILKVFSAEQEAIEADNHRWVYHKMLWTEDQLKGLLKYRLQKVWTTLEGENYYKNVNLELQNMIGADIKNPRDLITKGSKSYKKHHPKNAEEKKHVCP